MQQAASARRHPLRRAVCAHPERNCDDEKICTVGEALQEGAEGLLRKAAGQLERGEPGNQSGAQQKDLRSKTGETLEG